MPSFKRPTRQEKKQFAIDLRSKVIKSELWFNELYKPYRLYHDQFNVNFGGYIPDIINKEYKYVIEIDGSIHELESVKKHDAKKDKYLASLGYKVIRVKAYDLSSFEAAMKELCQIRGPYYKPAKIYKGPVET